MKRILCIWLPNRSILADPRADRQAIEQLCHWCRQFSPVVGLEDSIAPESLFLDVTDLGSFFGGENALAQRIVHGLNQRGLEARVAIADTVGAAWAASHFALQNEEVRSRKQSPTSSISSSSFIVHHSAFLTPLPIEALRLPEATVELLHQLGVYRIGQLESLPRADLTSRFGSSLLDRWDQAIGRLAEPIPALPLPPQLEVEQSLEYPTGRQEILELLLEQLIGRLVRSLASCGRSVVRLRCRLNCQLAGVRELSVGLFEPTTSARHLFQLVHMQLERLALPAPVAGISVEAVLTSTSRRRQEELFSDSRQRQRLHSLADLIDRLSSRLGSRSVVRAKLVPDVQPERAYGYHPLVDRSARNGSRGSTSRAVELPPRPLRLFCRPTPLSAVSIVPEGPLLGFCLEYSQHQVAHSWGPERIETGWWRGRAVARDYYRVETATGQRFWVFRDLHDRKWFMHGAFA